MEMEMKMERLPFNRDAYVDQFLDVSYHTKHMRMIAMALKDFTKDGKTLYDFEDEYGCKIIYVDGKIAGIKFDPEKGGETAFYLKYMKK